MLARLVIRLPFTFTITKEKHEPISIFEDDLEIIFYPPQPYPPEVEKNIDNHQIGSPTIDKKKTYSSNLLVIDFKKAFFNREMAIDCDPPFDVINKYVNQYLKKLRFIIRECSLKQIYFPEIWGRLRYLNDDTSELATDEKNVRMRTFDILQYKIMPITKYTWAEYKKLPADYNPPEWVNLYLDACDSLPHIGSAIVLAETALEVFIAKILDLLAKEKITPIELWNWINKREDWDKNPSVGEEFDVVLKALIGYSLKEDKKLWEIVKNLKEARNKFVHEGIARIGNNPVTLRKARELVNQSMEIMICIREKLPKKLQWPEYKHNYEYMVSGSINIYENV